jgi:carbon-monoxide dehydrogenase medium subunit
MWQEYFAPRSVDEALQFLAENRGRCRPIAGGTDLILEIERGVRNPEVILDVSRLPGLSAVHRNGDCLQIGALATHNELVASPAVVEGAFPLAQACWSVGAPQIRNRGTLAGNLVTASPANDTITPLWAMDATLQLRSHERGQRELRCDQFFLGVRRTALEPDELLLGVRAPLLGTRERGVFLKLGLRQAQAISLINVAVVVAFDGRPGPDTPIARARIALGSVAPTIVRAAEAEEFLCGRRLTRDTIEHASRLAAQSARPISDVRASADYRRAMISVYTERALRQLADGAERTGWPQNPVKLWGRGKPQRSPAPAAEDAIQFTLNGRPAVLRGVRGKTLLRALREDLGMTGTKEGCAEGECGACTVWLDGVAVMSCLIPVERVAGCSVTTIEGLAPDEASLHPVQQAFVGAGAVQCGYCTPGLVMSAANLLEEISRPDEGQMRQALTGNLCRCTGYYKILEALERAAQLTEAGR